MRLLDVVRRQSPPEPWAEGDKIPWDDPGFSRRMLSEHLSQEHDAASRRFETIERHVEWIHSQVLLGKPTRVLDLACGPGLYTSRLARLGHSCVGVDFSPAAVAHARGEAARADLACRYVEGDIRAGSFGGGYGLAMLIFGEINVFRREEARGIVESAHDALAEGGLLLLEPHTFEAVRRMGTCGTRWYASEQGLFSEGPHLCLQESFWNERQHVAIERYYVVDAGSGGVERYSASIQAYEDDEYRRLLEDAGFVNLTFHSSLCGGEGASQGDFMAVVAEKRKGCSPAVGAAC